MNVTRRTLLEGAVALTVASASTPAVAAAATMYGLIGKMNAVPGQRDALIAILLEGTGAMPGCLSYIVAKDAEDDNGIWISEVWVDQASHAASLDLVAVKNAISRGRPLIAGFSNSVTTQPVGGVGLPT
jgi:quinol monooxygenase YgiN